MQPAPLRVEGSPRSGLLGKWVAPPPSSDPESCLPDCSLRHCALSFRSPVALQKRAAVLSGVGAELRYLTARVSGPPSWQVASAGAVLVGWAVTWSEHRGEATESWLSVIVILESVAEWIVPTDGGPSETLARFQPVIQEGPGGDAMG